MLINSVDLKAKSGFGKLRMCFGSFYVNFVRFGFSKDYLTREFEMLV